MASTVVYKAPTQKYGGSPILGNTTKGYYPTVFNNGVPVVNTTSFYQELLLRNYVGGFTERTSAGTSTIYTVPAEYVYFLTSVVLSTSFLSYATGNNSARIYIKGIVACHCDMGGHSNAGNDSVSQSFAMPMMLRAGDTIRLETDTSEVSGICRGSCVGYLLSINETPK
jgi:hypothetical protein